MSPDEWNICGAGDGDRTHNLARRLLIGLWNEADDQGVFEWKPVSGSVDVEADHVARWLASRQATDILRRQFGKPQLNFLGVTGDVRRDDDVWHRQKRIVRRCVADLA